MITPLAGQPSQTRSNARHLSLDVLPAELIPCILTHLPPRDILLSFVVLSRRYKSIVGDFFRPDGRPGILVDICNELFSCRSTPRAPPHWQITLPTRLHLSPTATLARGRRIVATLDICVRTTPTTWGLDISSLASQIESTSPLAFAGVNKMPLLRSTPPHVLISWLSDPISRPVELRVTADMTSVLCSIQGQPSFPTIELLTYDGVIRGVPQHLRDRTTGLFPSCKHITLGRVSCSEDIPNMIHSLSGKHSTSLRALTVSGVDTVEDQLDPVFYALPQIVSAFPSLRSLTLFAAMDWIHLTNIEESKIHAAEAGHHLCDLHLRALCLPKNPSASLGALARSLSVMFPRLEMLALKLDDVFTDSWRRYFNIDFHNVQKLGPHKPEHKSLGHPKDMQSLLSESILRAFVDFVTTQPAHKVRLTILTNSPNQVKVAECASIIKKFGRMLHQMLGGRARGKRVVVVVDH